MGRLKKSKMVFFNKQKEIFYFGLLAFFILVLPVFVESKYYYIVLNSKKQSY